MVRSCRFAGPGPVPRPLHTACVCITTFARCGAISPFRTALPAKSTLRKPRQGSPEPTFSRSRLPPPQKTMGTRGKGATVSGFLGAGGMGVCLALRALSSVMRFLFLCAMCRCSPCHQDGLWQTPRCEVQHPTFLSQPDVFRFASSVTLAF